MLKAEKGTLERARDGRAERASAGMGDGWLWLLWPIASVAAWEESLLGYRVTRLGYRLT